MKPKALGLAAIAAVTFASPMFAQRYLNYDTTKSITMTGTVVGLDWMNPNNELYVRAKDPATDKDEQFVFLMAPPTRSTQLGWKPNTLKPGDTVTVVMHPAKDGSMRGQLVNVTLPDGRTLRATGPAPRRRSRNSGTQ
jgi:hypothetical protein